MSEPINIPRRNEQRIIVVLFCIILVVAVGTLCFSISNGIQTAWKQPESTIVTSLAAVTVVGIVTTGLFYLHFYYMLKKWEK